MLAKKKRLYHSFLVSTVLYASESWIVSTDELTIIIKLFKKISTHTHKYIHIYKLRYYNLMKKIYHLLFRINCKSHFLEVLWEWDS